MNIIVVGCGKIGIAVADSLAKENHNVTVIDKDAAVIENLSNIYDVIGVCGNGNDVDTLTEARVEKCDLFICTTGSDEVNMLSCYLAKKLGASQTVARIRNPEYNDQSLDFIRDNLSLSMAINPERTAAHEIYSVLKFPSALKIESFARRSFELVEIRLKPDSCLNNVMLKDLREKYHAQVLICAVQRGEKIYIPDGNFVLKGGDRIGISASPAEILKFMRAISSAPKKVRSVMIIGASRTAFYLSKMLCNAGNDVKLIEIDKSKCENFGNLIRGLSVINGDGAQQDLLHEEGITSMDAFISLTGMDEENILLSFYASSVGVPTVFSKINRDEFAKIAQKLGLDCVISPKDIVSDIIVRYARALQNSIGSKMETFYSLMDNNVEAMEFNVSAEFEKINIPIKNISLRPNILIAGIIRNKKTVIPSGDDVIMPGDRVVVIASGQTINDLIDIIK